MAADSSATVRGACLCGAVSFELDGPLPKFYRCHCSLCRRQSGTAGNAATLVATERFRWRSGQTQVGSWTKASGFRSDFCRACGSPLPNPLRGQPYMWVPAGLLDTEAALAYDPLLVKRLRRLRAARQKERTARRLGVNLRV